MTEFEAVGVFENASHPPSEKSVYDTCANAILGSLKIRFWASCRPPFRYQIMEGLPVTRSESGLRMSTRTATYAESPSIPKYEHCRPRLLKLPEQPFAVVHGTMRVQVRLSAAGAMP